MPKNILIIKPSALGDIALSLPSASSLRASFPGAKITWFIRPEFAPLLNHNSNIDEIILFDRKLLGKWYCSPRAFGALVSLIRHLRRGKFDLVIDLQGLFRTALFAWFSGCKKRFGMAIAREFASLLYTDKIFCDENSIHLIDYYQKVVTAAGASVKSCDFNLTPTPQAQESINQLLKAHNVNTDKYVVLVPGSAHPSKCWPIVHLAVLADRIVSQFGLQIVTVGTDSEKAAIGELKSQAKVPIIDFAGLTDIQQLVALLKNARLVVSNDTGPGHIAAALGVGLVIIFGETNPARVGPYKRPDALAAVDAFERGPDIESSDPAHKIDLIAVDLVFEKVKYQLARSGVNPDISE